MSINNLIVGNDLQVQIEKEGFDFSNCFNVITKLCITIDANGINGEIHADKDNMVADKLSLEYFQQEDKKINLKILNKDEELLKLEIEFKVFEFKTDANKEVVSQRVYFQNYKGE